MVAPPFETGAENVSAIEEAVPDVEVMVGAPGVVRGVTAADTEENAPVPAPFTAATLNT
jgi:hypothetical protein